MTKQPKLKADKYKFMREIKFRGLTKKGEWKFGYFWKSPGGVYWIKDNGADFQIIPETIGQYTGLKDKNGKEIYELMELNNKYEVIYQAPCYVLRNIPNGDIIGISNYKQEEYVITREYTKIQKN